MEYLYLFWLNKDCLSLSLIHPSEMEVSQRALGSLYIWNIWLLYIGVFFKPDVVSVSILVE